MRRGRIIALIVILAVILAVAVWRLYHPEVAKTAGELSGPVAQVQTAPIREGVMNENIAAYGSVIPAAGAVQSVSVPFESQVVQIMVNQGQKVSKGNDLLEIKPSPDTVLQLEQAGQAYDLAKQSLSYMERKFELKLATNDQVLQAKQALQQAQSRLESLKKRGVGAPRIIHADVGGLIKKVFAQEGAIVPAGNPLTGLGLGSVGLTEANEGDFFVRLKPFPRKPIETVMDEVRRRVEHAVPGLHVEMAQLMEDLIGDLTAVPQPIEIKIFSDNAQMLQKLAPRVAAAIGKISGVVDVRDGIVLAGDALDILVNRDKASLEGVNPDEVTRMVANFMTGVVTTQIQEGPKMVGVRVWTPSQSRHTIRDLEHLRLRAADGHLFPLKRIAQLTVITGQPQIMRDNLKRMVAVTGRISGRDMGSTLRDVQAALNQPGLLPPGVYYRLGGLYAQQQIAFAGLVVVFLAAVVLVFALLLFLYERFIGAIAILCTTLLALSAVFIGLWLTGTELNISSMMGLTMIVGIVTEVAIFYFSEYHALPDDLERHNALIMAGKNRMRPIAMSTLAAILALMPLALGIGQGAAMQQPLAIAIISGLAIQLPLVLVVLPVFLATFRRRISL